MIYLSRYQRPVSMMACTFLRAGSEPECGRALKLTPEIHVQSGVHYVAQVFHASRLRGFQLRKLAS